MALPLVRPVDLAPREPVAATTKEDLAAQVARARAAQPAWEAMGFDARYRLVDKAARAMLARRDEVVALLLEEAGKYPPDALMTEAIGPLAIVKDWKKIIPGYLARRPLPLPPFAFPGKKGWTDVVARGVAAVIAPWNYPLGNFFKPLFPALLVGNSVVVKPSEFSPRTGAWFCARLADELPPGVLECVHGAGDVGAALIAAGVDSLTFTGSVPTGKRVLQLAAEQMIPCSVELGGKDPALILPDCNLMRTVAGVMKWGLHNAGQDCGSIERIYVLPEIADRFVATLASAVGRLTAQPRQDGGRYPDIGPLNNERQLAIVEEHVADAVQRGAKVLAGGKRVGQGLFFAPTVLDHCTHAMKVIAEETFGPVLSIVRVGSLDEAVALANDSIYGLNASIWSADVDGAVEIGKRLQAGTVFVNNHALTGAMPFAPWTGVKQSGYGVANSTFALANYTRPKTTFVDRNEMPDPWWFPLDDSLIDIGHRLAEVQLGHLSRALKLPSLLKSRARRILEFVKAGG